jgi:hypothetical protein
VKGQYGEPWREPAGSLYEIASGMMCVATMATYPDAQAKKRRIIDCVNAMDGIDDPIGFMSRLREMFPNHVRILSGEQQEGAGS